MSDTSLIFNVLAKDQASATFNRVGAAAKVALAVAGAAVIKFGIDSAQAYAEAETAQLKLEEAFVKFPNIADTNIERLRALNTAMAQKTRFDDDATAVAQATLAQFQLTGDQIERLTPLVADFAAKTGQDLPSAAMQVGKALLGQGRALKQVGIDFTDLGSVGANFEQVMTGLTEKVGGFAEKEGQTAAGQVAILKNQFGELQEKVGGMLVPQLLKLVPVLEKTVAFFDRNAETIIKVGLAIGGLIVAVKAITFAQKAWTAAVMIWSVLQKAVTIGQWLWNAAMAANPIGLIIIAVIALVGAFIYLWTHSEGFRNFFIGMWEHIWGFLKAIGAWFAGPFAGFFVDTWNKVKLGFQAVATFVFEKTNAVIQFVAGLPGRIGSAAAGMWDGIKNAFRSAINWIIGKWNNLGFTIGGGSFLGMNIPSAHFGTPDIPYLDVGGTILRTGIAVVHKGETVVPAGRGGGVTVTFDFRNLDGDFAKAFRKTVRVQGAGNVQVAFGS